jgi:hypothetical protein
MPQSGLSLNYRTALHTQDIKKRHRPAHHGLASEAALHGSDRAGIFSETLGALSGNTS